MSKDVETNSENKKDKKSFKWTKTLIGIAINNGWTQEEIAKKCRTQQSVVSAWKRGEKFASESQIKPLLDLYGSELRRKTFRLYYTEGDQDNAIKQSFIKVEGKVIFTKILYATFDIGNRNIKKKRVPRVRLVLQDQGDNNFIFTICENEFYKALFKYNEYSKKNELLIDECINYSGDEFWVNTVLKKFNDLSELKEFIEKVFVENEENFFKKVYPLESKQIPFLVAEALLNHGFSIDGIEIYPSKW